MVVGVDVNGSTIRNRGVNIFDPRNVALAGNAQNAGADAYIATATGQILTSLIADRHVVRAGRVIEGVVTIGSIADAARVAIKREIPVGGVGAAARVAIKRAIAIGRVVVAGGVG